MANYCKPVRQLLEKVQENSSHITGRRQKAAFGVADATAVVSICVCACVRKMERGKHYLVLNLQAAVPESSFHLFHLFVFLGSFALLFPNSIFEIFKNLKCVNKFKQATEKMLKTEICFIFGVGTVL